MNRQDVINNLLSHYELIAKAESTRLKKMNTVLITVFTILILILIAFIFKLFP